MESPQQLTALIKVGGGKWSRKLLELNSRSFDILSSETCCREWRICCDNCISVKKDEKSKTLLLKVCPRNEKNQREVKILKIEFLGDGDEDEFYTFLTENDFMKPLRRVMVFVNPVSGRGRARQIWSRVQEMLSDTDLVFETVITERRGQALETVETLDLGEYDGVVTVSGDGGLHEIINGLYRNGSKYRIFHSFL